MSLCVTEFSVTNVTKCTDNNVQWTLQPAMPQENCCCNVNCCLSWLPSARVSNDEVHLIHLFTLFSLL